MRELLGIGPRPTGMWMRAVGTLVVLPLVLAGCGDDQNDDEQGQATSQTSSECASAPAAPAPAPVADLDLDGDGTTEAVGYVPAAGSCPATLISTVHGKDVVATVNDDLQVSPADSAALVFGGRTGEVLLIRTTHPRGGFQAHLYGYSEGSLEELTVDGAPIFPFVATDVLTDPLSADCTDDGFEITRARAHEPIGVAPAWDVDRTTYTLDGNTVTRGATTEVADNVLEKDFRATYRALTSYSLFENCRADR